MSGIKNGRLDQYGKVYNLNGIGGESVKLFHPLNHTHKLYLHADIIDDVVFIKLHEAVDWSTAREERLVRGGRRTRG